MQSKKFQKKYELDDSVTSEREKKQIADVDRFLSLSSSLICIAGFDGYFKRMSPEWGNVLGYPMDTLLSTPFIEFIHPDDVPATSAEADKLMANGLETITFVNRYRCQNGTYKWLQWNVTPDKETALMYCVADDITTLKKTRDALSESNFHLTERVKELNCLYTLSSFFAMEDTSLESMCQGVLDQISLSWQYPEIVCAKVSIQGTVFQTENFKETPWLQASDIITGEKKIGVLEVYYLKEMPEKDEGPFLREERALINVITEMIGDFCTRLNSAAALRQSEEHYRVLAEHTLEGVIVIQNGRLQYTNELFAEMLGYKDPKSLIGIKMSDLISLIYREPFLKMCSEIVQRKSRRKSYKCQIVSSSGKELWVEGHFSFGSWFEKESIIATLRNIEDAVQYELSIQKEAESLRRGYANLKSSLRERYRFGNIIGKSQVMQDIYGQIADAAATDSPVVILGETGTGKEEVARTIHNNSERIQRGFVPINCGAIPESLFESEFFGYKKGAFTGAFADKHGFIDLAHNGTVFLDEVGELNINMQVKLLRVLESGEYTPVGDNSSKQANVRIISATNADLFKQVSEKQIREDFYYRIHVIPICLPPLRERKEDIPLLAEFFLKKYGSDDHDLKFSGKELDLLCDYAWPGNIRELQNVVQRYLVSCNLDFMHRGISTQGAGPGKLSRENDLVDFRAAVQEYERRIIMDALEKNHWHKEKTASMLGLPKRTFFRKLEKMRLKVS